MIFKTFEPAEIPINLPGKLYQSPMPFSHFDIEDKFLDFYKKNNACLIVMLIEEQEDFKYTDLYLQNEYTKANIKSIKIDTEDFKAPKNKDEFTKAFNEAYQQLLAGKNVFVHCMAGIGRTGMFIGCLVKYRFNINGKEAISWTRKHLTGAIQSQEQEKFVENF